MIDLPYHDLHRTCRRHPDSWNRTLKGFGNERSDHSDLHLKRLGGKSTVVARFLLRVSCLQLRRLCKIRRPLGYLRYAVCCTGHNVLTVC